MAMLTGCWQRLTRFWRWLKTLGGNQIMSERWRGEQVKDRGDGKES